MTGETRTRGRPPGSGSPMAVVPLAGLRRHRTLQGKSCEECGEVIGVNKAHYSKIERGLTRLDVARAVKLADHLAIEVRDML